MYPDTFRSDHLLRIEAPPSGRKLKFQLLTPCYINSPCTIRERKAVMAKRESTSETQLPQSKRAKIESGTQTEELPLVKTLIESGTQTDELPFTRSDVHFRYELGTTERRVTLSKCADADVITIVHASKIVTLNYSRWKMISMMVSEINETLDAALKSEDISLKQHLGGNVYLSVSKKFPFVDLRKFFYPNDQITPYATRRGIALRAKEWSKLSKLIPHIDRILKMDSFIPCFLSDHHQNQMGALACSECNPFNYDMYLEDME